MVAQTVVILGGNFAGLTAALRLKHELHDDVEVTVISKSEEFLFNPSFIWIPFWRHTVIDVVFPLAPTCEAHGIHFVHAEATRINAPAQRVETTKGTYCWDYLVIATGYVNDFSVIPGLGPGGHAYSITSLDGAIAAGEGWMRFLSEPGPLLVGATQGAVCVGAAYEYVFNVAYQLEKHGLKRQAPLTYVSAEPFPGHVGIGGLPGGETLLSLFFKMTGIRGRGIFDVAMEEVAPGALRLADGRTLPFKYAMIVPPFRGADVVTASGLGNTRGFIEVEDTYQTKAYPNVYAAGIAAVVNVPWQTANAVGVPKTGFPSETMAHVAATNIAARIRGEEPARRQSFGETPAPCIMEAGNNGVAILAEDMLLPRRHGVMIAGPQSHAARVAFDKIAFAKYYLWKMRHGYVDLP